MMLISPTCMMFASANTDMDNYYVPINDTSYELSFFWLSDTEIGSTN